jgi:hypothetical protein
MDVGVDMPWQAAEPGLDPIHCLNHAGAIPALDHLFDEAEIFVGGRRVVETVAVTKAASPILSEPSSWSAASASIVLLCASVSRRAEASLVITSFSIAATDFRLANHCRRILSDVLSHLSCRA